MSVVASKLTAAKLYAAKAQECLNEAYEHNPNLKYDISPGLAFMFGSLDRSLDRIVYDLHYLIKREDEGAL